MWEANIVAESKATDVKNIGSSSNATSARSLFGKYGVNALSDLTSNKVRKKEKDTIVMKL